MMLFMVLFWVLIIAGIVYAIRATIVSSTPASLGRNGAFEILKERYARGEIDAQEYEERKRALVS